MLQVAASCRGSTPPQVAASCSESTPRQVAASCSNLQQLCVGETSSWKQLDFHKTRSKYDFVREVPTCLSMVTSVLFSKRLAKVPKKVPTPRQWTRRKYRRRVSGRVGTFSERYRRGAYGTTRATSVLFTLDVFGKVPTSSVHRNR